MHLGQDKWESGRAGPDAGKRADPIKPGGKRENFEFCFKCDEKPLELRTGEGFLIHILERSFWLPFWTVEG